MSSVSSAQIKADQAESTLNPTHHTTVVVADDVNSYDAPRKPAPTYVEKPIANAAPIGLIGFGITTTLLNIVNAGLVNKSAMVLVVSYGLWHGGVAQMLAGMWEIKRGNMFGGVAFTTYGAFWLGLATVEILVATGTFGHESLNEGLAAFLAIWGVFTLMMFCSTPRHNITLVYVFGTLTVLFFLLAWGQYSSTVLKIAGWLGMFCGAGAMYLGWAQITNEEYGRTVLPIFPTKQH